MAKEKTSNVKQVSTDLATRKFHHTDALTFMDVANLL